MLFLVYPPGGYVLVLMCQFFYSPELPHTRFVVGCVVSTLGFDQLNLKLICFRQVWYRWRALDVLVLMNYVSCLSVTYSGSYELFV